MRYITFFAMAIIFAGGCQKTYVAVEAQKTKLSDAEYREVFKAERLGEELIYRIPSPRRPRVCFCRRSDP